MREPIIIALGGNIGHTKFFFRKSIALFQQIGKVRKVSGLYESAPWGGVSQAKYLNAALLFETRLQPLELLHVLQTIEAQLGRQRNERWGPRTIDLDIILWGKRTINLPELQIPHPHWRERSFVLEPVLDLLEVR